jgi:Cd(II)/Pb(II)-responsive transcriptional regulator
LKTLERVQGQAFVEESPRMKIGELAQATQTAADTIRFYEREGLLPAPARTASNYRDYGPAQAERLTLIRRCRSLDLSLDEIRQLLRVQDAPEAGCGEVNALLDTHIAHVARRLAELGALQAELLALRQRCAVPAQAAACGILHGLHQGSGVRAA